MPILEEQPQVRPEVVRRLRLDKHISQQDLANAADISLGQINRIESGSIKRPQFRTLRKLAGALGVEIDDLLVSNGNNNSE